MTGLSIFVVLMIVSYVLGISFFGFSTTTVIVALISILSSLFVFKIKMKYLKCFTALWFLLLIHFIAVELARWAVHFLGKNITMSQVGESNHRLIWDDALKFSSYALYIGVAALILLVLHRCFTKYHDVKNVKQLLVVIFFMIFPTYTDWIISYTCGGFGGDCHRSLQIVVPLILSINPISMGFSLVAAYMSYKMYSHIISEQNLKTQKTFVNK
jgi:hypothetical protein